MRSLKTRIPIALITALVAIAAFAASANAGAYKVYSCKYPGGMPAPTDGWSAYNAYAGTNTGNTCATEGSLMGVLGGSAYTHVSYGSKAGWHFESPLPILSWSVQRNFVLKAHAAGSPSLGLTMRPNYGDNGTNDVDYCTPIAGCWGSPPGQQWDSAAYTNGEAITQPGMKNLWLEVLCAGGGTCTPATTTDFARVDIFAAAFVLEDADQPTFTAPTGSLIGGGALSGSAGVTFTATDPNNGSGVYRAALEVDGILRPPVTPNLNGGKCAAQGADAVYNDFGYIHPCPASTPVALDLDTTSLSDGTHSLRIRLYDAAGNSSTVYGPSNFTIKNKPDPINSGKDGNNGIGGNLTTAQFSSTSAKGNVIRTKYGRHVKLSTRLIDAAGTPISGAAVDVYEFVNVAGATEQKVTTLQSDGSGWVTYDPRTTANKLVTFKWSKSIGSSSYQATDATTMIVDGSLRMKAKHRKLRRHAKLQMTGKLYGENMPRSVPVQIQVKKGKKWSVVAIVNTKKNGTFKWNYRFKYVARGKFTFRALVRKSSDLSVEPASSKAVKVKVV